MVAALLIRIDPARQLSLHAWDEQFHAVVARNLMFHPLTPTLYDDPLDASQARNWMEEYVWLHKPPLAMWLMALSMRLFGVSAPVMRLPSVLVSTASVLLTGAIGTRLYGRRIGTLAAAFHAVNGLVVTLERGRRVADHVDTLLLFCVELGAYAVLTSNPKRPGLLRPALAGAAMGAGVLAKSFPAMVILPLAAVMWADGQSPRRWIGALGILLTSSILTAGPWLLYAQHAFPVEAASAARQMLQHATTVVEGQQGSFLSYLRDMPHFFGECIYVPVAWFLAMAIRRHRARARTLAVWLVVPYLVFSALPTKLPGFIVIASPAIFLAEAVFWNHLASAQARLQGLTRAAAMLLLILLALLPARSLLEPTGVFERRDRGSDVPAMLASLPPDLERSRAIIFNMPKALEAMFYSSYTAYSRLPTPLEIQEAATRHRPIVIYVPRGASLNVPAAWHAYELREGSF